MANPQQAPADNGARTQSAADTANAAHLEAEMADKLTRIYWDRRVQYQLDYYQKRAREYELNVDSAFRMGAILMTISSLLASLGIVVSDDDIWAPMISLLTAIIPAIVSYIAAFRQLYQWDRQLSLYRDTQLNLERAKLVIPDLSSIAKEDAPVHFPALVQEVENVLQQEISQWGQIARGEGDEEGDAERDLDATLRAFLTTTDGEVDEDQLQELTAMVKNAKETPRAGQFRQTEEDLNTNFFDGERQRRERIRAQQQEVQNLANAASQRTPTTTPERPELVSAQPPEYDVDEINSSDEPEDDPDPAPAGVTLPVDATVDSTIEPEETVISEPADPTPESSESTVDLNPETVETGINVVIQGNTDSTVTDTEDAVEELVNDNEQIPTMESPIVMPDVSADAPDLSDIDALQATAPSTETSVEDTVPEIQEDIPAPPEPDPIDEEDFEAQFPASDTTESAVEVADDFDDDLSDDAFVVDDYDIVDWSSDSGADEPAGTTNTDDDDDDTYADIEEINDY